MKILNADIPITLALASLLHQQFVNAHGDHGHKHHDHDQHDHGHNHLRHLNLFGSGNGGVPPGQCKDGDPTFTIGGVTYACESEFNSAGGQCKTLDRTPEEKDKAEKDFQAWKAAKAHGKGPNQGGRGLLGCSNCIDWNNQTKIITVPTYFHVIHDGTAGQQFTWANDPNYIIKQVKVMNEAFRGKTSSFYTQQSRRYPGYAEVDKDTHIQFCLMGTTDTNNRAWYADRNEAQYKAALRVGGMETLNVYVNTCSDYLGYAYFPTSSDNPKDGIVLLGDSMPGGNTAMYSEGDTLPHEAGHWLGLDHTFQGGCSGPGDYQSPTPARESTSSFNCPGPSPLLNDCANDGGVNPIHNFMAYTQDNCMDEFTPGQKDRIRSGWETYRHKMGYSELVGLNADGYSCDVSLLTTSPPTTSRPTPPPTPPRACDATGVSCTANSQCCSRRCWKKRCT